MAGYSEAIPVDVEELLKRSVPGKREEHSYVALFGFRDYDPIHLIDRIRQGLSYEEFERFQRNTELSNGVLAKVAEIPERTLVRRKAKGRFGSDETDRLVRVSRIVAQAIELFEGNVDSARRWLTGPLLPLGGRTPLEFAATDVGAIEVERLIGRLVYGIPS